MAEAVRKSENLPPVRGRYSKNAPLGMVGWFRAGGTAEVLLKPTDVEDLAGFLNACPAQTPVTVLGVMSNTIIRDGGVRGVTIRLGKEFAGIDALEDGLLHVGAAALDGNVAMMAARAGIAGLEFLSGIPGTIGGALRMNAGCYGGEIRDILVEAQAVDRQGRIHKLTPEQMGMSYRHTNIPEDYIFTGAVLQGRPGEAEEISRHIADIKARRQQTQPIRERTGGSTFANPPPQELAAADFPEGMKAWQLIEKAGGRGLRIGGAQMSELHCNFMINTGAASAADLENLGEEVVRRVYESSGIALRWEIKRVGEFKT